MRCVLTLLSVVASAPFLRADNIVANFSTATKEYVATHNSATVPTRQSYVLLQGRYFPGRIRDRGLEKTSFTTIARVVSHALQKKNTSPTFFPAKTLPSADLLVVVHWGVTIGRDRNFDLEDREYQKMHQLNLHAANHEISKFLAEPDEVKESPHIIENTLEHPYNPAIGHQMDSDNLAKTSTAINEATRGRDVAALLGFTADLRRDQHAPIASEHTRSLYGLLEEDRYFLLIYAYDLRSLRERGQLVVNWTTRLSIRSAGVNFATAINRLGEAGAATFGTEPGEVQFATVKTKKLKEDISIGDPIIIETLSR